MSSISSATTSQSSEDLKMNYLTLLTTQLSNQNPLDPMDNDQMTAQLTGLSQLEQTEKLNTTMETLAESQEFVGTETLLQLQNLNASLSGMSQYSQLVNGAGMIGKEVEFHPLDSSGEQITETSTAIVESVTVSDGSVVLNAGDYKIGYDQIVEVVEPAS